MPFERVETLKPVPQARCDDPAQPSDTGWYARLAKAMTAVSPDALAVVRADAEYVAEATLPRTLSGAMDGVAWTSARLRSGIVVGSVQSGKTANMLATSALLLDRGLAVLVILSGTRVALWLQTYERVLAQLDGSDAETSWQRSAHRVLVPSPDDVLGDGGRADPHSYLRINRVKISSAIRERRPVIFVVPKV